MFYVLVFIAGAAFMYALVAFVRRVFVDDVYRASWDPAAFRQAERMRDALEVEDVCEVVDFSMSFLEWGIKKRQEGAIIGSLIPDGGHGEFFQARFGPLDDVEPVSRRPARAMRAA